MILDMPDRQEPHTAVVKELVLLRARQAVQNLQVNKTNVDEALSLWVETMRLLGATWEQIGDMLGMTKQGALKKYGYVDKTIQTLGLPEEVTPPEPG